MVAVKVLKLTTIDIFKNPEVTKTALEELKRRRYKGLVYKALVGDRKAS